MKWLSIKGETKQDFGNDNNFASRHLFKSTSQIIKLLICLISTGMFLSGDVSKFKIKTLASASPQGISQGISNIAAAISVKVLGEDVLGSGFIVRQEDKKYVVITNQHVLRAGEAPYSIQTPDGNIYPAEIAPDLIATKYEYDLAVLQFKADASYPTAKIGNSLYLEVGELIFAAGFPYAELETERLASTSLRQPLSNRFTGLTLKSGRISIILNKALEEGYQIGYTNDVKKGMSGGPLLNSRGEVVGVNGKHAYPLWESPEFYQDGSQPCPDLQKLITRSSLAIPIEKTTKLNPRLASVRPLSDVKANRESNLLSPKSRLVVKMQATAKATIQSCQDLLNEQN